MAAMNTPSPSFRALELAYTAYPVTDVVRARAFYEGVLGLRSTQVWTEDGDGHIWIEYDLGGHTLALVGGLPDWKPGSDGPSLAIEVDDFDAAIAAVRAVGVSMILEPVDCPGCHMAVIRDPEGNALIIHRRKANGTSAAS